jgi:regulator of protease activity HflC (stomatin/prohibitin superfamily)
MLGFKIGVFAMVTIALWAGMNWYTQSIQPEQVRNAALGQMRLDDGAAREYRELQWKTTTAQVGAVIGWVVLGLVMFANDLERVLRKSRRSAGAVSLGAVMLLGGSGCYRPYEPVVLETIGTSEEGFLVPLTGNTMKQQAFTSEELLEQSMVATKQVQIPHRWIKLGYEVFWPNGKWVPSAILIQIDRAPITREWTADATSGTSTKNEAIWAMTSDQVEFSTGWTCTGRIATRKDAVKFLWNYPSGSLKDVMDTEIRARIQAAFGGDVTDKPMDELRLHATPVIHSVRDDVTAFFAARGITITTLGITGGFVYKDKKIQETMTKVFQAQQEQLTAQAGTRTQEERNKAIKLAAEGAAEAARMQAKGEADAIRSVADAKAYEIEKAEANLQTYLSLKQIEVEKARLEKWNGQYPTFLMGNGAASPGLMMKVPDLADVTRNATR